MLYVHEHTHVMREWRRAHQMALTMKSVPTMANLSAGRAVLRSCSMQPCRGCRSGLLPLQCDWQMARPSRCARRTHRSACAAGPTARSVQVINCFSLLRVSSEATCGRLHAGQLGPKRTMGSSITAAVSQ